jgi:molecular chaperone DnaK (HSP70)
MPTTSDELAYARSWIGELESTADFDARVDRLLLSYSEREEAVNAAIEEAIRARISVLTMDQPTNMSIQGISIGFGSNIPALQQRLKEFSGSAAGGSRQLGVRQLEREDPR